MRNDKFYLVLPAAGQSQRMQRHKLLLPWDGQRVIDQVLDAWVSSQVGHIVVLVRQDDQELAAACEDWPVTVHLLEDKTADMKETIQIGLHQILRRFRPESTDHCLISPADVPRLTTEVIDQVIQTSAGSDQIVVPYFGAKQGHPVCFPWSKTSQIFELATDEGLNSLIDRSEIKRAPFPEEKRARDIDTPADYRREIKWFNESNKS